MEIYNILISHTHNSHFLRRYHDFIISCKKYNVNHNIFKRSKKFPDGVYMESHHILPKAIWKEYSNLTKNPWNKIDLTPRQHFLAHWMLWKSYGGSQATAFWSMKNTKNKNLSSKVYEKVKLEHSERMSKFQKSSNSNVWRNKGSNHPSYGRKWSEESKQKISEKLLGQRWDDSNPNIPHFNKGRVHTKETKEKLSELRKGEDNPFYGHSHSKEAKEKIGISNTGRVPTEETIEKLKRRPQSNRRGQEHPNFGKTGENCKNFGKKHSKEQNQNHCKTMSGRRRHYHKDYPGIIKLIRPEDAINGWTTKKVLE